MAFHYYVYYRVDPGRIEEVRDGVSALLQQISAVTGIAGKVRRRSDEPALFMEVYEHVPDRGRFERWLDEAERNAGVSAWLADGQARHRECFED